MRRSAKCLAGCLLLAGLLLPPETLAQAFVASEEIVLGTHIRGLAGERVEAVAGNEAFLFARRDGEWSFRLQLLSFELAARSDVFVLENATSLQLAQLAGDAFHAVWSERDTTGHEVLRIARVSAEGIGTPRTIGYRKSVIAVTRAGEGLVVVVKQEDGSIRLLAVDSNYDAAIADLPVDFADRLRACYWTDILNGIDAIQTSTGAALVYSVTRRARGKVGTLCSSGEATRTFVARFDRDRTLLDVKPLLIREEGFDPSAVSFGTRLGIIGTAPRNERLFGGWLTDALFNPVELPAVSIAAPPSLTSDGREIWMTWVVPADEQRRVTVANLSSPAFEPHMVGETNPGAAFPVSLSNARGRKVVLYTRGSQLFARAFGESSRRRPIR